MTNHSLIDASDASRVLRSLLMAPPRLQLARDKAPEDVEELESLAASMTTGVVVPTVYTVRTKGSTRGPCGYRISNHWRATKGQGRRSERSTQTKRYHLVTYTANHPRISLRVRLKA